MTDPGPNCRRCGEPTRWLDSCVMLYRCERCASDPVVIMEWVGKQQSARELTDEEYAEYVALRGE
ncbi:MAG: hypothetical protein JWO67_3824 [Streptosporangiaceae bacterium]|nr:hypothetical protein [Streptosporangiaceae bacterium]